MKEPLVKAIIVEDMEDYIGAIEMLLAEVAPEVVVAGKATTLAKAEKLIVDLSPDVVMLDIQFENEGKTGFDLLETLKIRRKLNFQLIIITAHIEKQYYDKAFEYRAVHFLEKPVNKHKLADAIDRVKQAQVDMKLNKLTSILENEIGIIKTEPKSAKINIEGLQFNEIVDIRDIVWIEANGRKSNVYLCNDKKIVSIKGIGEFEKQLKDYTGFFRINRSEIINMGCVERYSKKEKLVVVKGSAANHYISKELFAPFVELINKNNL